MGTTSPLFKGATRPACMFGVPINVFVANVMVFIILGFYIWFPLLFVAPFTHFWLKTIADKDPQIFSQLFSYFDLNVRSNPNRSHWLGVNSLSPKQKKEKLLILNRYERN